MGRIVVGVDGSQGSRRALGWAAEEAVLRDATLEAVHVYEYTPQWLDLPTEDVVSKAQMDELRNAITSRSAEAAGAAKALVDELVADLDDEVRVETLVFEYSRPAEKLIEHAEGADLLVVGSRGLGGFKGLLLGSVSQQAATYAPCPVVVVTAASHEDA